MFVLFGIKDDAERLPTRKDHAAHFVAIFTYTSGNPFTMSEQSHAKNSAAAAMSIGSPTFRLCGIGRVIAS